MLLGGRTVAAEHPEPIEGDQHLAHTRVQFVVGDVATFERVHERLTSVQRGTGHLEIEPGADRLGRRVGAEPVADHQTVEAPLAAQHVGQQRAVGSTTAR